MSAQTDIESAREYRARLSVLLAEVNKIMDTAKAAGIIINFNLGEMPDGRQGVTRLTFTREIKP